MSTSETTSGVPSAEGQRHIVLFGKKGSGKTRMFRSMVGSPTVDTSGKGPHTAACRLISGETCTLVDTASLNDTGDLNDSDQQTTYNIVRRADVAVYVIDICRFDRKTFEKDMEWLKRNHIPSLMVFNKSDIAYPGDIARYKMEYPRAIFVCSKSTDGFAVLRSRISELIRKSKTQEPLLIPEYLVHAGDNAILVMPDRDRHAVRDLPAMLTQFLQRGVRCMVCYDDDLENTIAELNHIELIVAYARSFDRIRDKVPADVRLTTYSILYGMQKGDIELFAEGARAISSLTEKSRVLIADGCRCDSSHHGVGHIKIPRLLRDIAGEGLAVDYSSGLDLPNDIGKYDLVVHCGGCSISRRAMQAHIAICREAGVPIANYGTLLAETAGILDRCMADIS